MRPLVSVLMPVLDEVEELPAALDALADLAGRLEVVVVDGGSRDGTVAAARGHELRPLVLTSPPLPRGRAAQLNEAARGASGDLLLVLHVDTRLPETAYSSLAAAHSDAGVAGGNFALRFDGGGGFSRFMDGLSRGLRRHGIYYGDSAVFVRPQIFRALGGFRPLAIMDDYDFARRLERSGRTVCLPGPAVTSSRRWRRHGIARTLGLWLLIQGLYMAGVPASRLARLYGTARAPSTPDSVTGAAPAPRPRPRS